MFKLNTEHKKINFNNLCSVEQLFEWLPHDNSIIVIKDVLQVSADWGIVELDIEKILSLDLFSTADIPLEYSIELMAQSIGLVGAAQSKTKVSPRKAAAQAFVTGLKGFDFHTSKIPVDERLFVEILETTAVAGFSFCNCQIFQIKGIESRTPNLESCERVIVAQGVLKSFIIDK